MYIVLLIVLIIVIILYLSLYFKSNSTDPTNPTNPTNPPTPVAITSIASIDITNAPNIQKLNDYIYVPSNSYPGLYMGSSQGGGCIAIYTDSSYYYGIISELNENGSVMTLGNNSPIYGIVCFNPISGSAFPSSNLNLLGIYANIQPGVDVPATSSMQLYYRGSSTSTIGPSKVTSDNGAATISW